MPRAARHLRTIAFPALAAACALAACDEEEPLPTFAVTSLAFAEGETIPARHTCQGDDTSPPLRFEGAPAGTDEYAVVMTREDAGEAAIPLWIVWGTTADAAAIPEAVPTGEIPGLGVAQGTNALGVAGYTGPCPDEVAEGDPEDTSTHTYVFRAYALTARPATEPGATAAELLAAIEPLAVGAGSLTGVWGAD